MYQDLLKLEEELNGLLPVKRLNSSPPITLLQAAKAWSDTVWELSRQTDKPVLTREQVIQGKKLSHNPVFICGVHRSGTTLLQNLLDGHPELSVLPSEGTFFTNLAPALKRLGSEKRLPFLATEWLRRLANPINQPPYWLLGRSSENESPYVDFALAVSEWHTIAKENYPELFMWPHLAIVLAYTTCMASSNTGITAKYWVDKTPTNEKYLETIWREMPNARVIHMVRNPADVLLSRKAMESRLNYKNCLQDMMISYQTAHRYRHDERFLLLRYEDLCNNPTWIMQQICRFLNIELSPCLFTPTVAGIPAESNSSFSSALPAGQIIKERTFAKSLQLDKNEIKLLSAYLFKHAAQLGYPLDYIGEIESRMVRIKTKVLSRIS
ncbi:sulfotransferase family protein [Mucilaginibacter sp. AW1-3]